jgi:hypothetical protein
MLFNHIETLEGIGKKVDAITSRQLLEIANDLLDDRKLSYLIYH